MEKLPCRGGGRSARPCSRSSKSASALEQSAGELRAKEREITARRENAGREAERLRERLRGCSASTTRSSRSPWEEYELTRREAEEIGIATTTRQPRSAA